MSPVNSLWFKWKSLKLPWRKSFLVGSDLAGNTFWEFRETLNSVRYRRIVKYNPKTHYADVKVSPQWHQWLRYVRLDAPSIAEQQHEVIRQQQMKHLARLADERWASKPSFLDKPQEQHPGPATRTYDKTYHDAEQSHAKPEDTGGVKSAVGTESELDTQGKKKKSPWSRETGGPSENWQPESWSPTPKR